MNKAKESVSEVYDNIERVCKEKGMLVGTMCAKAGISTGVLSDLKTGRTASLTVKTVTKIADCLEVPVSFLLDRNIEHRTLQDEIAQ